MIQPEIHVIAQRARRIVETLAGEYPSRHGSNPTVLNGAASFIEQEFISLGYQVQSQWYESDGLQVRNIVVEKPGQHPADPSIVIGAHYDTVVGTPGADDNGTGIAGLIELSRLLKEHRNKRTIRFVAFPHEEPPYFFTHRMGSRQYARNLKESGERVFAMLALEMIGYAGEGYRQLYPVPLMRILGRYPKDGNFIALVSNLKSTPLLSMVRKAMRQRGSVGVESLSAPGFIPPLFLSDHSSFWKYGFPALMITDTAFLRNPHYHSSTDTADTLNYEFLAKVVDTVAAAVLALN
ncbi:MAG: M20/M25/M40 family metallo-hydrolase [Ignavibacteriales bacterium]|nr:M20/M25/M40 family metallo-hydrolase [Ignavibacteriales bacterium]